MRLTSFVSVLLVLVATDVSALDTCGLLEKYDAFKSSLDMFLATDDRQCENDTMTDCQDILEQFPEVKDGVYMVKPTRDKRSFPVYCDMTSDGGGWLVIQRRLNGSEDFNRNWFEYMDGFGNHTREFWLGNEYIHRLTSEKRYQLRIDLEDTAGTKLFALYDTFSLGDMSLFYALSIAGYSGNAGDEMSYHNNARFSAKNLDLDTHKTNCAVVCGGAWWFKACAHSSLNGPYVGNKNDLYWKSHRTPKIRYTSMKIRPKDG